MSKINLLNEKFIQARKDKNEIAKALFSTFRGEYDTAIKKGSPEGDSTIEKVAKKMTENALLINTADSLQEVELLKEFMPVMMSENDVRDVVLKVINYAPDKANNYRLGVKGAITGMVMKELGGKADANLVKKLLEEALPSYE